MGKTKRKWDDDYASLECTCGHSFFAHDSRVMGNQTWHMGSCQVPLCKCRTFLTTDQWLVPLVKQMEKYDE